jgi:2-keto-4-pentenoate hydratase/2-oxohepta-3-ene-1,7-dioic acid hydratase in catechol pathway
MKGGSGMKFVTFQNPNHEIRAGWLHDDGVVDMNLASKSELPNNMKEFLENQEDYMVKIHKLKHAILKPTYALEEITLMSPVPTPPSVRDFMGFEMHVKHGYAKRGVSMPPEWYEIPVFYFTNHHAIVGPNASVRRPKKCRHFDYELEVCAIIGKQGRDIKASEAEDYIFGFSILNDWSARDLQMQEMKVGLGPAKGKDSATTIGPYLVTKDELEPFRSSKGFDLEMTAKVNGKLLSRGNWKDLYYSFGEMIERASEDATLYPGDIIGSGTVGSGCIWELGSEVHRWLEPGDRVEVEVAQLGILRNQVI